MDRRQGLVNLPSPSFWQMVRPFRFLGIVYGLAFVVAGWEVSHREQPVDLYLDPQMNFTDTIVELYPRRGEPLYAKALQAGFCLDARRLQRPTPVACGQFDSQDLKREVRRYFEQGLATHSKTNEGMYYEYLQILVASNADRAEINAAYFAWRRNFPLSRLRDPR